MFRRILEMIWNIEARYVTFIFILISLIWHYANDDQNYIAHKRKLSAENSVERDITITEVKSRPWSNIETTLHVSAFGIHLGDELILWRRSHLNQYLKILKNDDIRIPTDRLKVIGNNGKHQDKRLTFYYDQYDGTPTTTDNRYQHTLEFSDRVQRDGYFDILQAHIFFDDIAARTGSLFDEEQWTVEQDGIRHNADTHLMIPFFKSSIRKDEENTIKFNYYWRQGLTNHFLDLQFGSYLKRDRFFSRIRQFQVPKDLYGDVQYISQGSFGAIFKAQKPNHQTPIVIKVMDISDREVAQIEHQFQKDAFGLNRRQSFDAARLPDNYIINPLGFVTTSEIVILEMEFSSDKAKDLRILLLTHKKPQYLRIILKSVTSSAVFFEAWNQKHFHGDIKPMNILAMDPMHSSVSIKVIDFSDTDKMNGGTARYLAPAHIVPERWTSGMRAVVQLSPGVFNVAIAIDMFTMINTILDLIEIHFGFIEEHGSHALISGPFRKFYEAHRETVFAECKQSLDKQFHKLLMKSENLAYLYREHSEELITALEQWKKDFEGDTKRHMPQEIINFVKAIVEGPIQFRWCEPKDFVKCYGDWKWSMLTDAAKELD